MRINKYIAACGYCSRRQADELIAAGRVEVNGVVASTGEQVGEGDIVTIDGNKIGNINKHVVLAYNKPVGIICTTDTTKKDNIIDAISYPVRIFPVGRLDVQTSGLILLTNDGDFGQKVLRPEYGIEKEYYVRARAKLTTDQLKQLEKGVDIGDDYNTLPAQISKKGNKSFTIVVQEGRNRLIRRMCDAVGIEILQLRRIRIGGYELGEIPIGTYVKLRKKDIQKIVPV